MAVMTAQTMQEKSSSTAEKVDAAEKTTATVEKKPSTVATAATRQPAYASAMNGAVPPALAGTTSPQARSAVPAPVDQATEPASEAPAETPAIAKRRRRDTPVDSGCFMSSLHLYSCRTPELSRSPN